MAILQFSHSKIISRGSELFNLLNVLRFKSKHIVFTNGCFDILHRGHIQYLAKAKEQGDILLIGLNTDESVKKLKGQDRPLQDQDTRALILASLFFVDCVVHFGEETPYQLIKEVQPDVLVKGSDYKPEDIVGYDIVTQKGGEVKTIDFFEGQSTTRIIQKMG